MRRLLIVRLDAIGDAILWNGAMAPLRAALPDTEIAIACKPTSAAIYETCPYFDRVFVTDLENRSAVEAVNAWAPDTLLHPVRSRSLEAEQWVAMLRVSERIALESDLANATESERTQFDQGYTRIIPSSRAHAHEFDRHRDVLQGLGVDGGVLRPSVWLTDADRAAADALLECSGHEASRTLVLVPAARWGIRLYRRWAEAITLALAGQSEIAGVAVIGDEVASDASEQICFDINRAIPSILPTNLCGRTTIRQAIAVIEQGAACACNETFAAHAAPAVGTPCAVVVGGGHLGRFVPGHSASAIACRPLACYGCDWRCTESRPHCIQDIEPETVARAIRVAIGSSPAGRTVFTSSTLSAKCTPALAPFPSWVGDRVPLTIIG